MSLSTTTFSSQEHTVASMVVVSFSNTSPLKLEVRCTCFFKLLISKVTCPRLVSFQQSLWSFLKSKAVHGQRWYRVVIGEASGIRDLQLHGFIREFLYRAIQNYDGTLCFLTE